MTANQKGAHTAMNMCFHITYINTTASHDRLKLDCIVYLSGRNSRERVFKDLALLASVQHLRIDSFVSPQCTSQVVRYEEVQSSFKPFERSSFPWSSFYFPDAFFRYEHIQKGGKGIVTTAANKKTPWLLT